MKSPIKIYTDGACTGNPGPGGWGAFIIDAEQKEFEFSGGEEHTTNNRMEMLGAIAGLENIVEGMMVELFTDSAYLKNGITTWIKGWLRNNWQTVDKKPVKNQDLWIRLHELSTKHNVQWNWIKGHAGHFGNERADALAKGAIVRLRISI